MAIACFGFVTFLPLRPERSLPCFIARISRSTFLPAEGEYFLPDDFFEADFREVVLFFADDFFALDPRELALFREEDFFALDFFALDFFVLDFFVPDPRPLDFLALDFFVDDFLVAMG